MKNSVYSHTKNNIEFQMNPQIFTISSNDEYKESSFLFRDIPIPIMNSLRRVILSELKNSGISKKNVSIIKNTTSVPDEVIKHRISMIPVRAKEPTTFQINAINTADELYDLTSSQMVPEDVNSTAEVFEDVLIESLRKGEELQVIIKTDTGYSGKHGVNYRPVENVHFNTVKLLYARNKNAAEKLKKFMNDNEFNLFSNFKYDHPQDRSTHYFLGLSDNLRTLPHHEIAQTLGLEDHDFSIDLMPKSWAFHIESLFIDPAVILKAALKKLLTLSTSFFKKKHKVNQKVKNDKMILKLTLYNSGVTEISVINYFFKKNKSVSFAQYDSPHPHENVINMHATMNKKGTKAIKNTFMEVYKELKKFIEDLL